MAVTITGGAASVSAPVSFNAQTGTTYTLALTDANNTVVTLSNTAAITVTIPPASSVAFPVGSQVQLNQINTGQVTVAAGSGVTLNGTPGYKLRAQWSFATLICTASNVWLLVGDVTP